MRNLHTACTTACTHSNRQPSDLESDALPLRHAPICIAHRDHAYCAFRKSTKGIHLRGPNRLRSYRCDRPPTHVMQAANSTSPKGHPAPGRMPCAASLHTFVCQDTLACRRANAPRLNCAHRQMPVRRHTLAPTRMRKRLICAPSRMCLPNLMCTFGP